MADVGKQIDSQAYLDRTSGLLRLNASAWDAV